MAPGNRLSGDFASLLLPSGESCLRRNFLRFLFRRIEREVLEGGTTVALSKIRSVRSAALSPESVLRALRDAPGRRLPAPGPPLCIAVASGSGEAVCCRPGERRPFGRGPSIPERRGDHDKGAREERTNLVERKAAAGSLPSNGGHDLSFLPSDCLCVLTGLCERGSDAV